LRVRQQILRRDNLGAGLSHSEIVNRLDHRRTLRTGWNPEESEVGFGVPDALRERRKIGVVRRKANGTDDLAAAVGEPLGEGGFRILAGSEIDYRSVTRLPALLGGPFADRASQLAHGPGHRRV